MRARKSNLSIDIDLPAMKQTELFACIGVM